MSKLRVIVTRPRHEAPKWVQVLAQAGYDAVTLPLIEVAPAPQTHALAHAWARLHTFDAVMFVSGNAVDYFFASKPACAQDHSTQEATKMIAFEPRALVTGPGSFAALQRVGVPTQCIDAPDLQAGRFDSEALWAVVRQQVVSGYSILIVRGADTAAQTGDHNGHGRDWFATQASAAGARVEFVVAYQRLCPRFTVQECSAAQEAASDGSIWLFSSSQAIANLVSTWPSVRWGQARAIATHPRIALAAQEAGFAVVCESRPTVQALLASIESIQ